MTALDRPECMNVTELMEVEKVSSVSEKTTESEGTEDPIIEKVSSAGENTTESEEVMGIDGFATENGLKENWIVDTYKNEDVGLGGVSFSGDQNGILLGKPDTDKDGSSGKVNQEPESNSVWLNECLLMSREMEALERKKRRKTEIFVGGLSKKAQEEDIRKVFEGAGEIVEVRLVMNSKMGKNKGFAFVRFAAAADAKNALAKYSIVEVKSVYAEFILSSWDVERVKEYFKRFGEVENVCPCQRSFFIQKKRFLHLFTIPPAKLHWHALRQSVEREERLR